MTKKEQGSYITKLHLGKIYRKGELIFLIDENKNSYPVDSLLFLDKYFNPQEGDIELPKVWEDKTETIKEFTGSTKPKEGDIIIFGFSEGKSSYPIILGSIIQLRLLGNIDVGKYRDDFLSFFDMQERKLLIKENIKRKIIDKEDGYGNIERSITTYEDIENEGDPQEERGTINFSISKEGDIQLDITEILEKTGKGNIVLNLKGNDGQANGNFTFNFNGKLNLINTGDDGLPTGTKISIDNTEGSERIDFEDKNGNKLNITTSGIVMTDINKNIFTMTTSGITFENKDGKKIIMSSSGSEINSGGTAEKMALGEKLDDYLGKVEAMVQEVMTALQTATYIAPAIPAAPSPLVVIPAGYIAAKAQAATKKELILSAKNKND